MDFLIKTVEGIRIKGTDHHVWVHDSLHEGECLVGPVFHVCSVWTQACYGRRSRRPNPKTFRTKAFFLPGKRKISGWGHASSLFILLSSFHAHRMIVPPLFIPFYPDFVRITEVPTRCPPLFIYFSI